MILTQSPIPPFMSLQTTHRRHPSAPPAVVVQPTKVPGILSISKPLRPSSRLQQPHGRHHRSPKPKSAGKTQPHSSLAHLPEDSSKPSQQHAVPVSTSPDKKTTTRPVTPAPDKAARDRQSKTPKDKGTTRSTCHAHGRRNNVRQPSPPLAPSLQAEPPFTHHGKAPTCNSFDPFLVSSDSDSENSRPPIMPLASASPNVPSLAGQPSGKLARRRRNLAPRPPSTPTPASRSLPVPRPNSSRNGQSLSRSAPSNSSAPPRRDRRSSAVLSTGFPVCDDTTDVEGNSPPSTPLRENSTWHNLIFNGPRTAPLSRSMHTFGVAVSTPTPTRRHRRTPSEGVFNLSFDEDTSHSDSSEETKKHFGLASTRFGSVGSSMTRAGKDKAGFFASSIFQNSPSPDELPPPAF